MSGFNYTADFTDVQSDFEPMPVGDYQVVCVNAEKKATKAGTGEYIKMEFDVMGDSQGNFKGRKLWHNINFNNPNPKAQEIGRQQLNGYMLACNLQGVTDTAQLQGYAVIASVKIKRDEQYGDGNEIKAFKAIGQAPTPINTPHPDISQPPTPPQGNPTEPAPQAQAQTAPPWG